MKKVFLYLYPIYEFTRIFVADEKFYKEERLINPVTVLNDTIDKRYRKNGYQIVYALYKDKEIYGIDLKEDDKIIYTDVLFKEATGTKKEEIKYPNNEYLINQLGEVDKLVIGGYHWNDCCVKVGECAIEKGIDTIIDTELTDIFYGVWQQDYFKKEEYDKDRYIEYRMDFSKMLGHNSNANYFIEEFYSSPAFGYKKVKKENM